MIQKNGNWLLALLIIDTLSHIVHYKPPDPIIRRIVQKNSVASVCKRTILTERPPLVIEVSANFLRIEGATWSAWRIPTAVFSAFQTGSATISFK
jgi:hypothetical protein